MEKKLIQLMNVEKGYRLGEETVPVLKQMYNLFKDT